MHDATNVRVDKCYSFDTVHTIVHNDSRALVLITAVDPSPTMSNVMCESRYVDCRRYAPTGKYVQ
jgi:hypothetical protein